MAKFSEFSRYSNAVATFNRNNKAFLILRKPLDLEPDSGDFFVTISKELLLRPDLISFQVYDVPDLWWVIYEFNSINDPFFDLKLGQVLRIPEKDRVLDAIKKLEEETFGE